MAEPSSSSDPAPPPAATSASRKLTSFDTSHANTLVASGKWTELEKYLSELIPVHDSKEAADKVHPGLFIIPREEQLLQMISEEKYDDAAIFFKMSIDPLKECKSDYRQFDLNWHVDDLAKITRQRSPHVKRVSTEEVQIAISDYFRLYFPDAISPKYQGNENSLWRFTVVLEAPQMASERKVPKSSSSSRPMYRCIVCQWIVVDQSIATMRYHFAHTKSRKACPKITQHLINRLNTMGVLAEGFPDLATLVDRGKKKRKHLSPAFAAVPTVHSVDTAVVVETADSMFEEAAIPVVGSVDAECQVGTGGAMVQKIEAAEAISKSLLDIFDSDASSVDHTIIVEKLRKQGAILKELKSDCFNSSLEHHLPAQSKEHPPAHSKELQSSPKELPPAEPALPKEVPPAPKPLAESAQSKELPPAHSKELQSSPKELPPALSKDDLGHVYARLENLFPVEDLDGAESMMDLQNICLQAIPEEQFDEWKNDAEMPSDPSTQI